MIISVKERYYDPYWDDFESNTHYYWIADPKVSQQSARLRAKAGESYDRAARIHSLLFSLKYVVLPLLLFLGITIPAWIAGAWIMGVVIGLAFAAGAFGASFLVDWINWIDGYGPSDGSEREEKLLEKSERVGHRSKEGDRVPIGYALGRLGEDPEAYQVVLEQAGEITRMLTGARESEIRELLAQPDSQLDPRLRNKLQSKLDEIEASIVSYVKADIALRRAAQDQNAERRELEGKEEDEALKAGNDVRAKLILDID